MQAGTEEKLDEQRFIELGEVALALEEYATLVARLRRRCERYRVGEALVDVSYVGVMSFACINPMIGAISSSLFCMPYLRVQQRRRLKFFATELLQNVSRHGYDVFPTGEKRHPLGYYVFRVEKGVARIVTANLSMKESARCVQERVTQLNGYTRDQICAMSHAQLVTGELSGAGGAGLGLFDVRKRSRCPIAVSRESVSESLDILELALEIPTELA